jgi:C-terminal domain on Strawberry notch homologue
MLCVVSRGLVDPRLQRDVARFLNRLLGLPLDMQELLFTYFTRMIDAVIAIAKSVGCEFHLPIRSETHCEGKLKRREGEVGGGALTSNMCLQLFAQVKRCQE